MASHRRSSPRYMPTWCHVQPQHSSLLYSPVSRMSPWCCSYVLPITSSSPTTRSLDFIFTKRDGCWALGCKSRHCINLELQNHYGCKRPLRHHPVQPQPQPTVPIDCIPQCHIFTMNTSRAGYGQACHVWPSGREHGTELCIIPLHEICSL